MLFSVIDDRSGVAYQEYRCVYGEDVEAGLRFLFNAMAPKPDGEPFQGVPSALYLDNGPVAKSAVFKRVMESLGVEVVPHLPAGSDGRRTTARAKGKVERPFRTVKDAHETLYHFHEPETEAEANRWLARFVANYNRAGHRSEPHSRINDWLAHLPEGGVKAMCAWERFCAFAREPERRAVGIDCRMTVAGVLYEVRSAARRGRLVGPLRPGALGGAWRGALGPVSPGRRADPAAPLPEAPEKPARGPRRQGRRTRGLHLPANEVREVDTNPGRQLLDLQAVRKVFSEPAELFARSY